MIIGKLRLNLLSSLESSYRLNKGTMMQVWNEQGKIIATTGTDKEIFIPFHTEHHLLYLRIADGEDVSHVSFPFTRIVPNSATRLVFSLVENTPKNYFGIEGRASSLNLAGRFAVLDCKVLMKEDISKTIWKEFAKDFMANFRFVNSAATFWFRFVAVNDDGQVSNSYMIKILAGTNVGMIKFFFEHALAKSVTYISLSVFSRANFSIAGLKNNCILASVAQKDCVFIFHSSCFAREHIRKVVCAKFGFENVPSQEEIVNASEDFPVATHWNSKMKPFYPVLVPSVCLLEDICSPLECLSDIEFSSFEEVTDEEGNDENCQIVSPSRPVSAIDFWSADEAGEVLGAAADLNIVNVVHDNVHVSESTETSAIASPETVACETAAIESAAAFGTATAIETADAIETAAFENSSSALCIGFNNVNVASGNVLVESTEPNANSSNVNVLSENVHAELIGFAAAGLESVDSGNVNVASGNVLAKSKELVADSNIVNVLSENVQVESSSRPHSQCSKCSKSSKSTSPRISPAQIAACFQMQNALIEQHKESVLLETELSKQEALVQLGQSALKERQQSQEKQ